MKELWGMTDTVEKRCEAIDKAKIADADFSQLIELIPFLGTITDEEVENYTTGDLLWMMLLYLYVGGDADWKAFKSMLDKHLNEIKPEDFDIFLPWKDALVVFTRTD